MASSSISGEILHLQHQQRLYQNKARALWQRSKRDPSKSRSYIASAQKLEGNADRLSAKIQAMQIQHNNRGAIASKKAKNMTNAKTALTLNQIHNMNRSRNFDNVPLWMHPTAPSKKVAPSPIPRLKTAQPRMQAPAPAKRQAPPPQIRPSTGLYGAQSQARLQQAPPPKTKKTNMLSIGLTMARIMAMGM